MTEKLSLTTIQK